MPAFISYSHQDHKFADQLARQMVVHNVHVWMDRWELAAGDSILERIQDAVDGASALLVVLSNSSVKSEWCKKELSSGLLRELEEKRVIVIPLLIEDCKLPLFVRGKLYADFRKDFDEGLRAVLEGIAKVTNPNLSRTTAPDFHTDWSVDWRDVDDLFTMRFTYVEQGKDNPYTVLTIMDVFCSKQATEKYQKMSARKTPVEARFNIVRLIDQYLEKHEDLRFQLSDQFEKTTVTVIEGEDDGEEYFLHISSRRLGEDTGKDILVNRSNLLRNTFHHMEEVLKGLGDPL